MVQNELNTWTLYFLPPRQCSVSRHDRPIILSTARGPPTTVLQRGPTVSII